MLINVSFADENESLNFVDIIDVPKEVVRNLDIIQEQFFKWIFDESNNHKYWVVQNDAKKYCAYTTEAFVDWINEFILKSEKAMVVVVNSKNIDTTLPIIYF